MKKVFIPLAFVIGGFLFYSFVLSGDGPAPAAGKKMAINKTVIKSTNEKVYLSPHKMTKDQISKAANDNGYSVSYSGSEIIFVQNVDHSDGKKQALGQEERLRFEENLIHSNNEEMQELSDAEKRVVAEWKSADL